MRRFHMSWLARISTAAGGLPWPTVAGADHYRVAALCARRRGCPVSISHLVSGLITTAGYPAVFTMVGAKASVYRCRARLPWCLPASTQASTPAFAVVYLRRGGLRCHRR
jgi:hypothetical protein